MKRLIASIAIAALLAGCSVNPQEGYAALESMGDTDIKLGGYALFGCGEDTFKTDFTATGVNGKRVKGVLCGGMFKGVTVRITG